MTRESSIIELGHWLKTAPGRCLVEWELRQIDLAVADAFGFHALQLGLPQIDALRANRMPHRWTSTDTLQSPPMLDLPPVESTLTTLAPHDPLSLHCDTEALPFPSQSIDLVVLPHTLELARDPHETLREVERVLVPEGRVVITGFNPASLWGLRQNFGHLRQRVGLGHRLFLPNEGEFIGFWRLRDWLRLLSFEVEIGRFGCWRPPTASPGWLERWAWIDRVGERWWPVLGAVYFVVAVKRVRGMRLVGLAKRQRLATKAATSAVATNHHSHKTHSSEPR